MGPGFHSLADVDLQFSGKHLTHLFNERLFQRLYVADENYALSRKDESEVADVSNGRSIH